MISGADDGVAEPAALLESGRRKLGEDVPGSSFRPPRQSSIHTTENSGIRRQSVMPATRQLSRRSISVRGRSQRPLELGEIDPRERILPSSLS